VLFRSLYDRDSQINSPFKERMQQEMNELHMLQYRYDHRQITQDQYYRGAEGYCQNMNDIHREFLSSNVIGFLG
jgi:hypothetical protein